MIDSANDSLRPGRDVAPVEWRRLIPRNGFI